MEKINVVIYRPGEKPTQVMLEPTYENLQNIVGWPLAFKEFPAPKGDKVFSIGYNKYCMKRYAMQDYGAKLLEDKVKGTSLTVKGPYFVCGEVLKLGEKLELLGVTADMFGRIKSICF